MHRCNSAILSQRASRPRNRAASMKRERHGWAVVKKGCSDSRVSQQPQKCGRASAGCRHPARRVRAHISSTKRPLRVLRSGTVRGTGGRIRICSWQRR
eukprot:4825960-Pleurochrysis_carterae.AAC.6